MCAVSVATVQFKAGIGLVACGPALFGARPSNGTRSGLAASQCLRIGERITAARLCDQETQGLRNAARLSVHTALPELRPARV